MAVKREGEAPQGVSWDQEGIAKVRELLAVNRHGEHQPTFEIPGAFFTAQMCPDVPRCVWGLSQCLSGVPGEFGPDFPPPTPAPGGW